MKRKITYSLQIPYTPGPKTYSWPSVSPGNFCQRLQVGLLSLAETQSTIFTLSLVWTVPSTIAQLSHIWFFSKACLCSGAHSKSYFFWITLQRRLQIRLYFGMCILQNPTTPKKPCVYLLLNGQGRAVILPLPMALSLSSGPSCQVFSCSNSWLVAPVFHHQ